MLSTLSSGLFLFECAVKRLSSFDPLSSSNHNYGLGERWVGSRETTTQANNRLQDDDNCSTITTSSMPLSEYQRRYHNTDTPNGKGSALHKDEKGISEKEDWMISEDSAF